MTDGSDWRDPEAWPPDGKGCWNCHVNPPVVWLENRLHIYYDDATGQNLRETRRYALCLECLGLRFPSWGGERVLDWLIRQTERAAAWTQGAEGRQLANTESLRRWLHG